MHLDMGYMKNLYIFTHVFWWSLYFMDTEAFILDRQRCQEVILADFGVKSGAFLKGHKAGENQRFYLFLKSGGRRKKSLAPAG